MDGKTALGASSPAKPALHIPDPLSITRAATSSSAILTLFQKLLLQMGHPVAAVVVFSTSVVYLELPR